MALSSRVIWRSYEWGNFYPTAVYRHIIQPENFCKPQIFFTIKIINLQKFLNPKIYVSKNFGIKKKLQKSFGVLNTFWDFMI